MQLILLSGGSGKRLWPLSNDARSKQFLQVLEREDGKRESMIQRVVRQTGEAGLHAPLTVATNTAQRDSIINQLGEQIHIVAEPERRNTFPAIALATMSLYWEKGCSDEEVIVVMPCDPYTELGYFKAIARMAEEAAKASSTIVLMGIQPSYPSTKYGYIVPTTKAEVTQVKRFVEKPGEETAARLLQEGALWNGGVFAFRLGYMRQLLSQYIHVQSFDELVKNYSQLPKNSFDYEVVEKASALSVVAYSGQWKDLGTWNTLTEQLAHPVAGNAHMGEKCTNTHIINELEMPVFCDGLQDMVVACSPDGILVCSKERSEHIKQQVEHLSTRPMYESRRWGTYRVLSDVEYADGTRSLTKTITLHPDKNISYQVHHHRDEVWTIVDGEGRFVLDGVERPVKRGDVLVIRKEQFHAIRAVSELTFIEVQTGCPLIEEDIERFDYDWR